MNRKFTNPFLQQVHVTVNHRRENCLILTTGKVQKGKSRLNLTFASSLDPEFTIDRCVWMPTKFTELIHKGHLKRGNAVMFEEIGTEAGGIPRRKWYDFNNFIINDVLQTFGFEGLIVFLSVPTMDYIDTNALKLVDYRIIAKEKYMKHDATLCKIYEWEWNEDTKKFYRRNIMDYDKTRKKNWLIKVLPDSSKLVKQFYQKEFEYKRWIQKQGFNRIAKEFADLTPIDELRIQEEIFKDLQKGSLDFWKIHNNQRILSKGVVQTRFGIGSRIFERIRDNVYHQIRNDDSLTRKLEGSKEAVKKILNN